MIASNEMLARINKTVYDCFVKVLGEEEAKKHTVKIQFKGTMRMVAGRAHYHDKKIELNTHLFEKYTNEFFSRTIPHEAAHLITHIKFPKAKQHHGKEWKYVMSILGAESSTCHEYDISCVYPEGSLFKYVCACENKIFNFTKVRHNRAQSGERYIHTPCGSRMIHFNDKDIYGVN